MKVRAKKLKTRNQKGEIMDNSHFVRIKSAIVMLIAVLFVGIVDIKFITWLFLGAILYFAIDEAKNLFTVEDSLVYLVASVVWIAAIFVKEPIYLIFLALMTLAAKLAYDKSIDRKLFLPILYPLTSWLFIWSLYIDYGIISLLWLLVIVALSDIGAYYVGKKFGSRKFSPTSPNKTIEGVFGGIFLATLIGAVVIHTSSEITFLKSLIVALLTSISSIFGDLFESYLKREAGVKDSGNIIPGHGGILDRVDGYLFASVMLYIILNLG